MTFDTNYAIEHFPEIFSALPVVLWVTLLSALLGVFGGALLAAIRINAIPVLNTIASLLISLIRSTPILVQLYVVCYGLPRISALIQQNPEVAARVTVLPNTVALVTFTLYASAYFSEIFKAAYFTVREGQRDAIRSFNLNPFAALRRIVIPQAALNAIPNLSNSVIDMLKNTSLLYTISVMDIMAKATIIASQSFKFIEIYTDALVVYLFIAIILFAVFAIIETIVKRMVHTEV
ncbi:MAG: amino acid ABC transporter permease [Bifidobacterium sp.]|jgi:L-cystine transport system permease protein|nr:amino acid ABC transporter permease [Bifidobacterium sp.]MCH4175472.1 amino acid ABC transporter permease [Bifidobacterium sp.]